jgi:inorganic triphosphatase YgiF
LIANSVEVELKLSVAPEDLVVLRDHSRFTPLLQNQSRAMLDSVYFDSDDHFLRDHGFNLRVRRIGDSSIQCIKSTAHGVGLFERSEWERAIEGNEPNRDHLRDTPLGRIMVDDIALKPVFETRFQRTACHVNSDGADIVIAIDQGEIIATGASRLISEIELELKQGSAADLFRVARDILDIVPAHLGFKSKSERGYELAENAAVSAETACDPELNVGISAGRAFTLVGRACLRQLAANVELVIARDGRALHQLRVALRRLRAAISLFSAVVADDRAETIKTELRWLAHQLGPARDLDTLMVEVIKPLRQRHRKEPGLVSISNTLTRQRLKSYRQAEQAIRSARFRALVLDTTEWIEAGPWSRTGDAPLHGRRDMPIEIYAAEQLARRYRRIRRRGAGIGELDPQRLHRLRIQVKKARYATEFFAGLYQSKKSSKRLKCAKARLSQLQAYLGGLNDIVTHKALFMDIIDRQARGLTENQSRRRAFAAGLVVGDQEARMQHLLDDARKAHSRFVRIKPFWKRSDSAATAPAEDPQP